MCFDRVLLEKPAPDLRMRLIVADWSQNPTCVGFQEEVERVRLQSDFYLHLVLKQRLSVSLWSLILICVGFQEEVERGDMQPESYMQWIFTNRLSVAVAARILPAVGFYKQVECGGYSQNPTCNGFYKQVKCGGCSQNPTCVKRVRLETESYLHWVLKRGWAWRSAARFSPALGFRKRFSLLDWSQNPTCVGFQEEVLAC